MSYLTPHGTRAPVPQSEKLRDDQVANSAGGFVWQVDKWSRLRRFLILGSEGGTYYIGERKLTKDNVASLRECLAEDGVRTVNEIVDISTNGRAPKNDQAIFALATAVALGDDTTKKAALDALPQVCRIGTHLFQWATFMDESYGRLTGRAKRRALGQWLVGKDVEALAYQMVKYRQRDGWQWKDLLRLAHPAAKVSSGNPTVPVSADQARLFAWAKNGGDSDGLPRIVEGFTRAQASTSAKDTAALVREYRLPREALPTEHLNEPEVWQAMLDTGMPMTAMIRNLATMTRIGVIEPMSAATKVITDALGNDETIRKARVHPVAILMAMSTYASGHGFRSSQTWTPVREVVDALDAAFYTAFGNVTPTGKRLLLALDVSGSMGGATLHGTNLTARDASAAMALVTAAVEKQYEVVGFYTGSRSHSGYGRNATLAKGAWVSKTRGRGYGYGNDGLTPLAISPRQRLTDAISEVSGLPFGGTDCALPMLYAMDTQREFDAFLVFTDSETWAGSVQPAQALQEYRKQSGLDAKLVVIGMTSNEFSIADPQDAGMLDVVGFDTSAPNVMAEFISGTV